MSAPRAIPTPHDAVQPETAISARAVANPCNSVDGIVAVALHLRTDDYAIASQKVFGLTDDGDYILGCVLADRVYLLLAVSRVRDRA